MATASVERKTVVKSTTDEQTKRAATEVYRRLGMSLSAAINVFLHQSVIEGGMPFTPGDPFYSTTNMAALAEGISQEEKHEVAATCTVEGFDNLIESL